jgi:lysophospholipase L1-like esterase
MPNKVTRLVCLFCLAVGPCGILSAAGNQKADLSRLVIVGDSLGAGFQNGQLIETGQVHGYGNVIATQAGVSLNQPLLPSPGYPQITVEQGFALMTGFVPIPRLNTNQTFDLAVPGFTVAALVGLQSTCPPDFTNPIDVMAVEILNPSCSAVPGPTELEEAAALKPTTAILWVGANDVLFSLLFGAPPTPLDDFTTATGTVYGFRTLYHIAATTMASASGHLVLANVPDVTLTAYLTSVPKLAAILNLPVPVVESVFGLQANDMVTPYAFAAIQAMGTSLTTLPDSGPQGPIVIRAATLTQVRDSVRSYNAVIASEAAANGATLVDIWSLVNSLAANGQEVGGQQLTTDFLGGLFSEDGVHPTNTGYAIIANEFIKTMNSSIQAGIPPISVEQVSKTDPLLPNNSHGKQNGHVSVGMADGLRALGRP